MRFYSHLKISSACLYIAFQFSLHEIQTWTDPEEKRLDLRAFNSLFMRFSPSRAWLRARAKLSILSSWDSSWATTWARPPDLQTFNSLFMRFTIRRTRRAQHRRNTFNSLFMRFSLWSGSGSPSPQLLSILSSWDSIFYLRFSKTTKELSILSSWDSESLYRGDFGSPLRSTYFAPPLI